MPDPQRLDREQLDRRLSAVERALTGEDHDADALAQASDLGRRVEGLETDLAAASARIDDLEAAVQAVRGYVGNVRSVNEDVEQRAEAALAAVDRIEARLDERATGTTSTDAPPSNGKPTESLRQVGSDGDGRSGPANVSAGTSRTGSDHERTVQSWATAPAQSVPQNASGADDDRASDGNVDASRSLLDRLRETL